MTPRELAKLIDVKPNTVYSYIRAGRIKTIQQTNEQNKTKTIDDEYGQEWARVYNERKQQRAIRRQQQIERELLGEV